MTENTDLRDTILGVALIALIGIVFLSGCSYKTPHGTITYTPDEPLPVVVAPLGTRTVEK